MSSQVISARNIIDGSESAGGANVSVERLDPANGRLVSRYDESSKGDVDRAVAAARSAFETSDWSSAPKLREETLRRIFNVVTQDFEELASLQTRETGKVISDSRAELRSAGDLFDYYSGMARNVSGRTAVPDPRVMSFVMREPLGVVGMIVPWNAPLVLLARSLAPALAAGNAVVVKPSSHTPGVVYDFLRRVRKNLGDAPRGVLNLVLGSGGTVGRDLVLHTGVDMISFTGSTTSAKQIIADSAVNVKRLSLELGGKSPNIIFDDGEFDVASLSAIKGQMLGTACQVCFAGTRVIVQDDIYDKFKKNIATKMPSLSIGDGIDPSTDVGPLISEEQVERVMDYVETGKREARLVVGGNRLTKDVYSKGHFVEPTLFEEVPTDSKLAQEEVFGPVISLMRFGDLEEAAEIANNTKYGLSAAIWTKDVTKAFRLAKKIKAGMVWVNHFGRYFNEVESGGYKESGLGRLRGVEGLNAFTQTKTIALDIGN